LRTGLRADHEGVARLRVLAQQAPRPSGLQSPSPSSDAEVHVHRLHGGAARALAEVVQARHHQHLRLAAEDEEVDAVGVVAALHVEEAAARVSGSRNGITRMKRSPS